MNRCYTTEIDAFTGAVERRAEDVLLSYSPGGGNTVDDGAWVAETRRGGMYRIVTDFHGGWYGWGSLQQSLFIQANFSAAGLAGANGTWPDPDMLPMRADWWGRSQEQDDRGATIFTAWTLSGAPLMHAGELPADPRTAAFLANPTAARIHGGADRSTGVSKYYDGNCSCVGDATHCTIPRDVFPERPCVAVWAAAVDGASTAAAAFNLGENATTAPFDLARILDSPTGTALKVEDVWSGASLGTFPRDAVLNVTLRPHASAFFLLSPAYM